VTPHSRRRLSIARAVAFALAIASGWLFFRSTAGLVPAIVLLFIALVLVLFDRDRMRRIECERCRGKALVELEKTKPDLKNTEINIM
jgi:hypothetical protein